MEAEQIERAATRPSPRGRASHSYTRPVRVSELFHSIQGEGKLAGVPSAFVRASGCNLRCVWCDTPYASWRPEGGQKSVIEVVDWVRRTGCRHVVFTGGEPVIQPDAEELCAALADDGLHVTLETAGTVFKPLRVDLLSLSPKLSNSTPLDREGGRFARVHDERRLDFDAMQKFIDAAPDRQVKFVVSAESDLTEIEAVLSRLTGWQPADVLLMPEGTDTATLDKRSIWLADLCRRTGYRFCPRLHVYLYGNTRGT